MAVSIWDVEKEVKKEAKRIQSAESAAAVDPSRLEEYQSVLESTKLARKYAGSKMEGVAQDIAARDTGKRRLRERQAGRMASLFGSIVPRTMQQTASLLTSSGGSSTLLG